MAARIPTAALGAALLLMLTGCGRPGPGASPADASDSSPLTLVAPPKWDDDSCGLEGMVATEDLLPLAGAQVTTLSTDQSTVTALDGRFSFSYLPAGRHQLVASLEDYNATNAVVDCPAGTHVQGVTMVLDELSRVEPAFFLTYHAKGHIGCSWGFVLATPDLCQKGNFNPNNPGLDPAAKSVISFRPDARAQKITGAAYEVEWTRSQGLGSDYLRLTFPLSEKPLAPVASRELCPKTTDNSTNGNHAIRGPSVLCIRLNPANAEDALYRPPTANGPWGAMNFTVWAADNAAQASQSPTTWRDESSKLVMGQDFALYVTWFYNGAQVPPGFTAIG